MGGILLFPKKRLNPKRHSWAGRDFALKKGGRAKFDKWKKNNNLISKEALFNFYTKENKSMQEIASALNCSLHKIAYWMEKYKIKRRSRSDAMYTKHNPDGDPFKLSLPKNIEDAKLFGLGLGLYWGEGTKANLDSIRLGNTDPKLLKKFIQFLVLFFNIKKSDLKFALQIFSDIDPEVSMDFWTKQLKIDRSQFNKTIVTKSGSIGNYRKKSEYGVLTVMYHNKRLRNLLVGILPM